MSGAVRLHAVEEHTLAYPILIGRDFFDQQHIRLIKELGVLKVEENTAKQVLRIVRHNNEANPLGDDDLMCGSHVDAITRVQLLRLLGEFRNCFAKGLSELGVCSVGEIDINLSTDEPITQRPYRLLFAKREK